MYVCMYVYTRLTEATHIERSMHAFMHHAYKAHPHTAISVCIHIPHTQSPACEQTLHLCINTCSIYYLCINTGLNHTRIHTYILCIHSILCINTCLIHTHRALQHVSLYVCMYVCMYAYIYIHIYIYINMC